MKEAIERLREATEALKVADEAEKASAEARKAKGSDIIKARKRLIASLCLDIGPEAFEAILDELYSVVRDGGPVTEQYADEIAAIERERAETAQLEQFVAKKQASDPEIYPMPKPGDRLTAGQLKDAPDGTVVDMPSIAGGTTRFTKNVGFWLNGSTAASGLSGECTLVRWGYEGEATPTPRPTGVLTAEQANGLGDGAAALMWRPDPVVAERLGGAWRLTNMLTGAKWTASDLDGGPWLLLRRVDHG